MGLDPIGRDSRVEESNLARIMAILMRSDAHLSDGDRSRLGRVLNERRTGVRLASGGIDLTHLQSELSLWVAYFTTPATPSRRP
jgi:hypothetical protein